MNDTDYFFDSLRQITDWSKKAKRIKDGKETLSDGRAGHTFGNGLPVFSCIKPLVCVCVRTAGGPVNIAYLVFFMRKLWFNVIPGRDAEADLIFHFPQVHLNDAGRPLSPFPGQLFYPRDIKRPNFP